MPRFTYTVLSSAVPGREDEFEAWYADHHLKDVVKMPGVISGKLFKLDFHRVYDLDEAPQWTLMTIYELVGDDPQAIVDSLKAASGTSVMSDTGTLTKVGMVQVAGHLVAEEG